MKELKLNIWLDKLKMVVYRMHIIKNKIVYKIKSKIYNLMYRRVTYVSEKGMWISTVVFPAKLTEDGHCGVTDVFPGNEKKVDFDVLHSEYIKEASESRNVHREVVKLVKNGLIVKDF